MSGISRIQYVQSASVFQVTTVATRSLALPNPVTPGNAIAVFACWNSATVSFLSITDTLGNAYVVPSNLGGRVATATPGSSVWGVTTRSSGGACTVTLTTGATTTTGIVILHEVSGVSDVNPIAWAAISASTLTDAGVGAIWSPSLYADTLGMYHMAVFADLSGSIVPIAGPGWDTRENAAGGCLSEDRIWPAGGRFSANFSRPSTAGGPDILASLLLRPAQQTAPLYQRYTGQ